MAEDRSRSFARAMLTAARDVGVAVVLTLLICEAVVRGFGLDPGEQMVMIDIEPEDDGADVFWPMPARYDPDGNTLRDEAIADPPRGATRLVLLGDSIFFGVHLPPDKRVGALLSRSFAVADLAAPGYSTVQMRIALNRHIKTRAAAGEKVGAVVFSLFHNDSASWARAGSGVRRGCLRFRVPLPGIGGASIDAGLAWRLYRASAAFRATCRPFVFRDRQCREDAEVRMLAETRAIHAATQAADARLVVLLLGDTDINWRRAKRKRALLHMYNVIAKDMRSRGAIVVDTLPLISALPHADAALDTTGHLKARAHKVLADIISQALATPQ